MIKRIFIIILFLTQNLCAAYLYIDNFNDGASPNLLGGPYAYDSWGSQVGSVSLTYESNTAFGNFGKSLKFNYTLNGNDAYAQIRMAFYPDRAVNLTNYQYLSFRIKADADNTIFKIYLQDTAGTPWPSIDIRNFLPGGKITTTYQKIVIPLTAFRYDQFVETSVTNIYFWIGNGLQLGNHTIYLDEIILSSGASPIYIDNMEVIEPNYELSALAYNIYSGGGADPTSFWSATNIVTNNKFLGTNAYYCRHITRIGGGSSPYAWAQSVWMLKGNGAELSPLINASACNKLVFYAKKDSNKTSEKLRYIYLADDTTASSRELTSLGLTTSWKGFTNDLSSFAGVNMQKLREFRLVAENNGGNTTNITFIDEIKLIDTLPPQAPTNIRVDGIKLTNNFKFSKGSIKISATVYSNESLDKSLEAVMIEYRKNSDPWKIIGFDYNTDRKDFTNVWNTVNITGTNNIDLRISSIDSTSNRKYQIFTGCSINDPHDSFRVTLSNVDVAGILAFGSVSNENSPKVAQNSAGTFSYAFIDYDIQSSSVWKIILYTDNTNALANPKFKGQGNFLYGNVNDGTGLIGNGGYANSNHSTPIKVWCNATNVDGTFARAPCDNWSGAYSPLQGVPDPKYQGGETNLYWKNQDLNGNGTNDNTLTTFNESTYNYDANGDGDKTDTQATLGKVFEYSSWRAVTGDSRVITGAQTPVLIDNGINSLSPNNIKVYFAITDDLAGVFKSNQLIFELIIQ